MQLVELTIENETIITAIIIIIVIIMDGCLIIHRRSCVDVELAAERHMRDNRQIR